MCLRIWAIRAAEPPVTFASGKEIGLSGEVTMTSKAAGLWTKWAQVVGWPALGTISLSPSSHLELTTQAAELGNDIIIIIIIIDNTLIHK